MNRVEELIQGFRLTGCNTQDLFKVLSRYEKKDKVRLEAFASFVVDLEKEKQKRERKLVK